MTHNRSVGLLLLELKYICQAQRTLKLTKYKTYRPSSLSVRWFSIMPPKGSQKVKSESKETKAKGSKEKDAGTKKKADKKEESDDEKQPKDDDSNNKNEVEKSNETKSSSRGWGWGHKKKVDGDAVDDDNDKTKDEKSDETKTSNRGWGWGHKRKADTAEESKPKAKKKRDSIVDSLQGIDSSVKAKTPDGKEASFKIASWNVNGLRAWLEKEGLEYVKAENPDVFCVQETKCDISKIPEDAKLEGYTAYWLSGDTEGYSGVGIYYRTKPIQITEGIGDKEHDQEGRVITAEFDKFYLVNTYIPNSGRGLPRLDYRTQKWDTAFRSYLKSLDKKKPVVWCGDLNVAHKEIDLKNPKGNLKTAGFTEEERDSFTDTLKEGFFDSFRYLHPKEEHAYTFWTYMMNARGKNAGWRLDYFVLSERLKDKLCDSAIRSKVLGSDHCPIVLQLAL